MLPSDGCGGCAGLICVYWRVEAVVYVYVTWRGQALRCLSLHGGNAKA